jgi:hypothetical protein
MRGRLRLVTALRRRPVRGAAVSRHHGGERRRLEHEPGKGEHAQPLPEHCHRFVQLSGSVKLPQTVGGMARARQDRRNSADPALKSLARARGT